MPRERLWWAALVLVIACSNTDAARMTSSAMRDAGRVLMDAADSLGDGSAQAARDGAMHGDGASGTTRTKLSAPCDIEIGAEYTTEQGVTQRNVTRYAEFDVGTDALSKHISSFICGPGEKSWVIQSCAGLDNTTACSEIGSADERKVPDCQGAISYNLVGSKLRVNCGWSYTTTVPSDAGPMTTVQDYSWQTAHVVID